MALLHYLWSRAAGANATADANVGWSEGQAPSSVNDSARNMMASLAGYRDDIAGAIVTAGTPTAYTITSYQVFDTLAHMSGQMIAFSPHATNGASPTLNVDGLGAKAIVTSPGAVVQAGTLIAGSPYVALYDNVQTAFILQGFYGNPYNIPLGGMIDYIGSTAPNSALAFPTGQAISRTTYATLFSLVGTTYGVGDGSTTFNLPNLTGYVTAMKEASATRLTSSFFGGNSTVLGAVGGSESQTLSIANLAAHDHGGLTGLNNIDLTHTHTTGKTGQVAGPGGSISGDPSAGNVVSGSNNSTMDHRHAITSAGSGTGHNNVQSTFIVNKLVRVI